MRLRSPLLAALPLLASACAVGPDYSRPEVALPAAYMGSAAPAAAPADLAHWWDGFDDPLLTRYVTAALAENLDLAQAMARVAQARAQLGSATAALLPSAQVSGQAAAGHQSNQTALGRVASAQPGYDRDGALYETDLDASWEIDLFGGLRRQQEAARAEYQAAAAAAAASRLAVAAQTADTYVVIRGLQARLAVAQAQIDTQQRLLDTVRLQYSKGIAAELQARQAEGALAQVQATVPDLTLALDQAMNAFDVLLATPAGTHRAELATAAPIPAAPTLAGAGTPADLLRRRPDIIVAERKLAASNARIGTAIAEYYPKISLSGLLGTATTAAGGFLTGGAMQAQGGVGLRWRLFDFGRIDAEVAAARGGNSEALAAYRLSVLRATQDVEDSLSAFGNRSRQEAVLAAGEDSLARARAASFAAYKGGVVSLIEVLDADSRLLATRDARIRARAGTAQAAIASFRALGGGWDVRS
ncbi:efflux transporter outer membrane subunit [Flavisphingomonas formosensis]|uniref:efflux transporter outer membrane subunit n=1 Tax=Flavisphingomonas formosensis TaxID=861534 RepID=UPI0012F79309|nr:efflux transporter outer membrane subunit [Sphingomonas formosensis]